MLAALSSRGVPLLLLTTARAASAAAAADEVLRRACVPAMQSASALLPCWRGHCTTTTAASAGRCLPLVTTSSSRHSTGRTIQCMATVAATRRRQQHNCSSGTHRSFSAAVDEASCAQDDERTGATAAALEWGSTASAHPQLSTRLVMVGQQDEQQQPPGAQHSVALPQWLQLQQQQQPEQQQHEQLVQQFNLPEEVVLVGIDPDTNGAIAVVRSQLSWAVAATTNTSGSSSGDSTGSDTDSDGSGSSSSGSRRRKPAISSGDGSSSSNGPTCTTSSSSNGSSSGSTAEVPQLQAFLRLPAAAVAVYDMPVETIVTKSKTSTGKLRVRRRVDIMQAMALVRQVLHDTAATAEPTTAANSAEPGNGDCSSSGSNNAISTSSSSTTTTTTSSSSSSTSRILLRAVVEVASIQPRNGSLATLNQGFSVGAWTALLAAHGFDVTTAHVLSWKRDMGLLKQDKDCSRELARRLYCQAGAPQDQLLRTKNTHGRAEALLLAAWGLGWSAAPGGTAPCQGPMRATVHMDGGRHSLPLPQHHHHHQQQQLVPDASAPSASAAAADGGVTSDDEAPVEKLLLICKPGSFVATPADMPGVVTRAHLTHQLQPPPGLARTSQQQYQQQHMILDVAAQMQATAAAAEAAVSAKAAAKQAAKERRAAERQEAAARRAAERAEQKAAKQQAAAAAKKAAAAGKAAAASERPRSRRGARSEAQPALIE